MIVYSIPPHWEVLQAAPSSSNRLLVCGKGRYFQLAGLPAKIISAIGRSGKTCAELQRELVDEDGRSLFSSEQIQECISKLASYGILTDGSNESAGEREKEKSKWFGHRYFAVRVPLLPPKLIYPITKRLAPLYSPFWIAVLCPTLLLVHLSIWLYLYFTGTALRLEWPGGTSLAAIVIGNYLGLLLHELGHAAACVRCNIRHGTIGLGIYLVLPAFYTDVSEAWKLSRSQRMAVDAAGMYTSLILSSIAFILFVTTGNYLFFVLMMLYDLSVLMNLNPFIRMDCYWLLSDALGVCNLMALSKEMTAWIFRRICRLPTRPPALLRNSSGLNAILLSYYTGSLIFASLIIGRLFISYVPHYLMAMPGRLASLQLAFELHGVGSETAGGVLRIALSSVPLLGMVLYGARGVSRVIRLLNEESQ